jgi:hypothetical protein
MMLINNLVFYLFMVSVGAEARAALNGVFIPVVRKEKWAVVYTNWTPIRLKCKRIRKLMGSG